MSKDEDRYSSSFALVRILCVVWLFVTMHVIRLRGSLLRCARGSTRSLSSASNITPKEVTLAIIKPGVASRPDAVDDIRKRARDAGLEVKITLTNTFSFLSRLNADQSAAHSYAQCVSCTEVLRRTCREVFPPEASPLCIKVSSEYVSFPYYLSDHDPQPTTVVL